MKQAQFYKKLEYESVQCQLCPHNCILKPNKKGLCGVRQNIDGILFSLNYDKLSALAIDLIEKKPLYHFFPGKKTLSIAAQGCNFSCSFCQNSYTSQAPKPETNMIKGENVPPERIVELAVKNDSEIISYTYSEPTIFYELAYETAKLAHEKGMKNVFVTNGFINPEPLRKIAPYLDAANIDLKSFSDKFYNKTCGGSLKPVQDAIKLYHELGIWLEVTTLLIPDENDSDDEIRQIADFIAGISTDIPWHISRFHPDYKMTENPVTPIETLEKAYDIGRASGLYHIYLGNVHPGAHENTSCPECKKQIIKRSDFTILEKHIESGRCSYCKNRISGRWQ
ncbi:MAG: AmmeMemoRadiSam system radical SAM enzyme [Nanoarchaeota archaeon]|nr:AmmeMemoRadiSam system radical SAM enzyme [Nanoarchaeota archaeon]